MISSSWRQPRRYTGVDWISRGAKRERIGQNKGSRLESLSARNGEHRGTSEPRVQSQSGLTEKKTSTPGSRVLVAAQPEPPTAKNLIRCHNYIQWCSTPPDSLSLFPCRLLSLRWILIALSRELRASCWGFFGHPLSFSPSFSFSYKFNEIICASTIETLETWLANIRELKAIPRCDKVGLIVLVKLGIVHEAKR